MAYSIPNLVIRQGSSLPVPIHFEFGSGMALGWKEWVDRELSDTGFMGFNLRHLVRQWCTATHTFFFSCSEITVTLEDVANQLLLPILGDVDPSSLELSLEEEVEQAELKKRMNGNAKLSCWVSSSYKFSVATHRAAFVTFWLYKFIFGSHPHYPVKPLYFYLAIKISVRVSLPLALTFLGHLYVQLDILRSDEDQAGSCHIVTSSVHSTVLQHLLYERCAKHLAKCRLFFTLLRKSISLVQELLLIFVLDSSLSFRWSSLKPIYHPVIEFFDKGVGFSWRAYRHLGVGYTCANSVMGQFVDTAGTTTPLVGFEERGITYLAATNARWLPYLGDEGIGFVHYPANQVRRQFGLDQDIPNDLSSLIESPTSVRPFLQHTAFDFLR